MPSGGPTDRWKITQVLAGEREPITSAATFEEREAVGVAIAYALEYERAAEQPEPVGRPKLRLVGGTDVK